MTGDYYVWPEQWAIDSVQWARNAYRNIAFQAATIDGQRVRITVALPSGYVEANRIALSISIVGGYYQRVQMSYPPIRKVSFYGRVAGIWFGVAVIAILCAKMSLAGDRLLLQVDDAGAPYPLTIDPVIQETILTSPDPQASQYNAVAYDANAINGLYLGGPEAIYGNTFFTGAAGAPDANGLQQGAVYLFGLQ